MPPFLDMFQLQNAVTGRALPALQHLAANPNRRDSSLNNRFERDDPPPYESSSESAEEEAMHHPVLAPSREAALAHFGGVLSKPLNDTEAISVVSTLNRIGAYSPEFRWRAEAEEEHERLNDFWRSSFGRGGEANEHVHFLLKGPRGYQRRDVIVRRNIRKRWQRLGMWNPDWGIPGRVNRQPNDDHPINRAVQLRRNAAYRERAPPPPRSHLRDDSSVSEAESFIISRPWFIFEVEVCEFRARERRIPMQQRGISNPGDDHPVTKCWEERGDWEPTWKWRHESPSPEPEDLTPLNTDAMDYTPSEVDALEAIPPNSPARPIPAQPDMPAQSGGGVGGSGGTGCSYTTTTQ
ncbi:hypothetical protein F5Y17DRAFT_469415 [Xylariaceae sp. FL0594]|nr:hypothetical protein F5Y17DRAFT_469415 [Xylariaceae sp. FL0594]